MKKTKRFFDVTPAHPLMWILAVIVLLVVVMGIIRSPKQTDEAPSRIYAAISNVTTINYDRGFVGFTDSKGRELYLYHTYGWNLGDSALLAIESMDTDYLYDDYIISATYYETPAPIA